MQLENQTVVVLGGSSGIGFATARAACESGARVAIVGRSKQRAEHAASSAGATVAGYEADAGDSGALRDVFNELGHIDHLVLTAAGGRGAGPINELETAELRRGFDEKFWVHWNAVKVAPAYFNGGGSITFVGAARSRMADPASVGLAAINGALDAMVPPLAKGLAPVRVNMISPGVIDTPPWDVLPPSVKEEFFRDFSANLPSKRVGRPEEVAHAILSVICNDYVTGVVLEVDGGMHL